MRLRVSVHASEPATAAQPVQPAPRFDGGRIRPYIPRVMRRITAFLGGLVLLTAPVLAQSSRPRDTLPPRAYVRLAMRARAADSVTAQAAVWSQWAADEPTSVAPRFALALLARYDLRYRDALAWLDSASRRAATPLWTNAIARERVTTMVIQGEFTDIPPLMRIAMSDSAAIPLAEWAESRYIQLGFRRRLGNAITMAALDSIEAISTPADSLLRARVACLRTSVDPARIFEHAATSLAISNAVGAPFIAGNCELQVGSLLSSAGQMSEALKWFARAESTSRAAHDLPTLAATLQWHGYALSTMGYVPWAQAKLAESIRIAQTSDDRNVEAWALLGIANSANQIGDAGTASTALRRSAILFDATGDKYGTWNARLLQASTLMQLGDTAGAGRLAGAARAAGDSLRQPSLVLRSLYTLGDLAVRAGQFDRAAELLDTAGQVVRQIGTRFQTQLDSYRGVLALNRGQYPEAIRLLQSTSESYVSAQDLFRHAANGALALAWLRSGDTAQAARRLIDANDQMDRLRDSVTSEGLRRVVMPPDGWGGSSANPDHVLAAFVASRTWLPTAFAITERTRARALMKGSFGIFGTDTSSAIADARRRVRATATVLTEVQKALTPTTALLVYAGGASTARTSLMIVTRTSARGVTLAPLDSLDRDIVRWLALLESGATGVGAGRRVAAAVLASALNGLPAGIKRLVIVPQGPLYRVPFQALPFRNGVVGDRVVVTIAPSVSLALAYAEQPRSVPARVLAFGAGDTEVASATPQSLELSVERSERGNPLAALTAAADEARAAAGWAPGSLVLTGAEASESALKRESRGSFTVLHAAAHALTSDQALGANWLILRPDGTDDGYVSGGELAELSVGRAMVVLSGCRTTGDFGSRGDAIDGLVAPLLARGVRTVVASHWAVSDRWTRVLMERFYQNLAAGATTAEAMNTAQSSLRQAGVPARFWAAFSVIGDGALTFAPTRP